LLKANNFYAGGAPVPAIVGYMTVQHYVQKKIIVGFSCGIIYLE
jgi:hypothetical protein